MKLKRTNKLLALLLAVLMVTSLLPVGALAAPMAERTEPASGEAGGDDAYEINGDAKPALRAAAKGSGLLGASPNNQITGIKYTINDSSETYTAVPSLLGKAYYYAPRGGKNDQHEEYHDVYLVTLPTGARVTNYTMNWNGVGSAASVTILGKDTSTKNLSTITTDGYISGEEFHGVTNETFTVSSKYYNDFYQRTYDYNKANNIFPSDSAVEILDEIATDAQLTGFAMRINCYGDDTNTCYGRPVIVVQFLPDSAQTITGIVYNQPDNSDIYCAVPSLLGKAYYYAPRGGKNDQHEEYHDVYLVTLPTGARVTNYTMNWNGVGSAASVTILGKDTSTKNLSTITTGGYISGEEFHGVTNETFTVSSKYYNDFYQRTYDYNKANNIFPSDSAVEILDEIATDAQLTGFAMRINCYGDDTNTCYGRPVIVVQFGETSQKANKSALQTIISELSAENYYTENDRFNGKESSVDGFWADLQPVLVSAQKVLNNANATQTQVDDAVAALTAAKEKLIPKSQINPTELYEAIRLNNIYYPPENEAQYTTSSWTAYRAVMDPAESYLRDHYNDPVENKPTADAHTTAVKALAANHVLDEKLGDRTFRLSDAQMAYTGLKNLYLNLFNINKLSQEDYTEESWSAYALANEAAGAFLTSHDAEKLSSESGVNEVQSYSTAYQDYWTACYGLTKKQETITVTLDVTDTFSRINGEAHLAGGSYVLTLPRGATVEDAAAAAGLNLDSIQSTQNPAGGAVNWNSVKLGVYVNGVYTEYAIVQESFPVSRLEGITLNDGDRVLFARMDVPVVTSTSGVGTDPAGLDVCGDYILFASFRQNGEELTSLSTTAGTDLGLEVTAFNALPTHYSGRISPLEGAEIYRSEICATEAEAKASAASIPTSVYTRADGSFSLALYSAEGSSEGWYLLNVLSADTNPGLTNAANLLVHVTDPENLDSLRENLKNDLTALEKLHADDFYTDDQLVEVKRLAEEGRASIDAAQTSGDINKAYTEAAEAIKTIQKQNDDEVAMKLENLRFLLGALPTVSDAEKGRYTSLDPSLLTAMQGVYGSMTAHQKGLLTRAEQEAAEYFMQLAPDALAADTTERTITFRVVDANTGEELEIGMEDGQVPLRFGGFSDSTYNDIVQSGAGLYQYGNSTNIFSGNDYLIDDPCYISRSFGDDGAYHRQNVTVRFPIRKINVFDEVSINNGYEIVDASVNIDGHYYTQYKTIWNYQTIYFFGPREDIVITVYVQLAEPADPYVEQLTAAYTAYSKADYSSEKWAELLKVYQNGLDDIKSAADDTDKQKVLDTAIAAMAAVEKKAESSEPVPNWGAGNAFDAGVQVGTVTVIAENTTFPDGAFTDTIFRKTGYAIGEKDNMMTVILRALADEGFTWTGTGGDGYDISYLATISKDGKTMGEFSGEPGSGWMGALNEFMVNEGLSQFSVAAGTLGDGDEIKLMFTQNLGADLGGTWGNSDTTLASLELSTGTLIPGFASGEAGNTYDFALMIPGSSAGIQVTPHATNINYMVKTFLNEKVTDNTQGNSFYRRTETITVRPGDVIWVGVGEKAWPSMNKVGAEARSYSGTWYALHVISADNGADYVNELIAKLPTEKKITYDNYTDVQEQIAGIEQVMAELSSGEQAKVNSDALNAAKAKAESFRQIDAVKQQLAALPKSSNLSDSEVVAARRQIEAADAAYKAMTDEQKGYITVGDVANYNALVERLAKLVPDTTAETITGSEKKPEKDENEVAPAQVAVAPEVVNGEATAEITAEDVSKAIEEAPDAKALTVTVSTEGADKVEASLPAEAVKAAADAGMGVNVATENGAVKLSAADVKAASGKDLAVSVKQNADGTTTFDVTAGGAAVDAAVKIELPATGDGQVLVIVDADGKETVVKKSVTEDGKVYAEIPAGAKVKAVDAQGLSFGDVKATDWFAGAVEFVTSRGIFQGTGTGFEPNATMNRAMLVTVLQRIAGEQAKGENKFGDVKADAWYADAVIWASENGIVNGTDAGFEPDAPVTREQIATMLYRFVQHMGVDVSGAADLSKFDDGGETADWASEAMRWAVSAGLFRGDANGSLNPKGDATRAEVATLLQRLVKLIVK